MSCDLTDYTLQQTLIIIIIIFLKIYFINYISWKAFYSMQFLTPIFNPYF